MIIVKMKLRRHRGGVVGWKLHAQGAQGNLNVTLQLANMSVFSGYSRGTKLANCGIRDLGRCGEGRLYFRARADDWGKGAPSTVVSDGYFEPGQQQISRSALNA